MRRTSMIASLVLAWTFLHAAEPAGPPAITVRTDGEHAGRWLVDGAPAQPGSSLQMRDDMLGEAATIDVLLPDGSTCRADDVVLTVMLREEPLEVVRATIREDRYGKFRWVRGVSPWDFQPCDHTARTVPTCIGDGLPIELVAGRVSAIEATCRKAAGGTHKGPVTALTLRGK